MRGKPRDNAGWVRQALNPLWLDPNPLAPAEKPGLGQHLRTANERDGHSRITSIPDAVMR